MPTLSLAAMIKPQLGPHIIMKGTGRPTSQPPTRTRLRPHEFARGHVSGAVNIPLKELASRVAELDPANEIMAYCSGACCVFSFEAVAMLRSKGFKARRLEDGLPEWKAA